jgi:hypothetical protein
MLTKTISAAQYARFEKLLAKDEKQKRYQQVQSSKNNLRAKWAVENNCPITKQHAEFYTDMDERLKNTLSLSEIIAMADSKDSFSEPNAHVITEMHKKKDAEAPDENDSDAQGLDA